MRIAIVGGGISGLTAAYHLAAAHHVALFEANSYLGGHINTVAVEIGDERHQIDTGFIVFNDRTYPNFTKLLAELGVAAKPTEMSFSVRDDRAHLEYNGHSLRTLFAQKRNLLRPSFHRMLLDIVRFNRVTSSAAHRSVVNETVREFVNGYRFSSAFAEHYLLPMGSAIWSCPRGRFADFPVAFVIEFFRNHGLLSLRNRPTWYVIEGGSHTYVKKLSANFAAGVRLNSPVESVVRTREGVVLRSRSSREETFDHVIFACHSDQALRILGNDATPLERNTLSAFPYVSNVAVLHTDASLLPRRRRAWASWNCRVGGAEASPPVITYNMNILQRLQSRHTFCVTLNAESEIAQERVLGRYIYHHPTFDHRRAAARSRQSELLNSNRTSFCGAYWGNGFHEDGVVSAMQVVAAIERESRAASIPCNVESAELTNNENSMNGLH
ncbi:NAD(P)/FAD-dependent oxidoreductase [Lacipirellula sp.]|uniref:NAD(P)/FAD-dependent oxidoreductase n=1 Tax=Lacipirellula sp. TaxID=2691419 RepID=UPI003D111133